MAKDEQTGSSSVSPEDESGEVLHGLYADRTHPAYSKALTLVLLEVYSASAVAYMLEAESMVERAIQRRDAAREMFSRATWLAIEFANGELEQKQKLTTRDTYDDIAF